MDIKLEGSGINENEINNDLTPCLESEVGVIAEVRYVSSDSDKAKKLTYFKQFRAHCSDSCNSKCFRSGKLGTNNKFVISDKYVACARSADINKYGDNICARGDMADEHEYKCGRQIANRSGHKDGKESSLSFIENYYKCVIQSEIPNHVVTSAPNVMLGQNVADNGASELTDTECHQCVSQNIVDSDRNCCLCNCHRREYYSRREYDSRRDNYCKRNYVSKRDYQQDCCELLNLTNSVCNNKVCVPYQKVSNITRNTKHKSRKTTERIRKFQTRFKSEQGSVAISFTHGTVPCLRREFYKRFLTILHRVGMAQGAFYFVMFLVLCICAGVFMHNTASKTHGKGEISYHIQSSSLMVDGNLNTSLSDSNIIMDLPFRGVSVEEFEKQLPVSSSAADLLKLFFNKPDLTADQVNSIMFMKSRHIYGTETEHHHHESGYMMSDVEDESHLEREAAYNHYKEVSNHPISKCHSPVPRCARVQGADSVNVRRYLPECTIVHRCADDTACCPHGMVCGPKDDQIEIITKHFMVFEMPPGRDVLKIPEKNFIVSQNFINHTVCECRHVVVNTNCKKHCPAQFTKSQPGKDCECVCSTGHRKCVRIQRGETALDEKDLECIKNGGCIAPKCTYGAFKVTTGFCPPKR